MLKYIITFGFHSIFNFLKNMKSIVKDNKQCKDNFRCIE